MWLLIGTIFAGLLCLLGGCTLLWWTAKLINVFVAGEEDEVTASVPRASVFRELHDAVEKDFAQGALTPELHDALNSFLRRQESAASQAAPAVAAPEPAADVQPAEAAPAALAEAAAAAPARADKSHVLQSLGIVALYLFVVSFVHSQMWAGAVPLQRCVLLLMATLLAFGIGGALCRWTALRIAGLGFALFAHAAVVLDALALSLQSDLFAPSPLVWTMTGAIVSVSAAAHAWFFKAVLFETVAVASALAAWGFGALYLNVPLILVPAVYVPLVIAAGIISRGEAAPRWSYRWALRLTWRGASVVLALGLPVRFLDTSPASPFAPQAVAIAALGVALAIDAGWLSLTCAGVALLVPAPLYAFTAQWPAEQWSSTFAVPGAMLACAGAAAHLFASARWAGRLRAAMHWGQVAVGIALAVIVYLRLQGLVPELLPLLVALLTSVSCAALLNSAIWSWLAVASAGLSVVGVCDHWQLSVGLWPLPWTAVALAVHALAGSRAKTPQLARRHARLAADVLLGLALVGLLVLLVGVYTQVLQAGVSLAAGWLAAAGCLLAPWDRGEHRLRQDLGWVCLGPALAMSMYAAGSTLCLPALFLALLTLGRSSFELFSAMRRPEPGGAVPLWPAGLLALHAAILTMCAGYARAPWLASASLLVLAGAGLVLALRLRVAQTFDRAAVLETLSFVIVAGAAWGVLPVIASDRVFDPLRAALATACTLFLSWLASVLLEPVLLSFPSRTSANPYRRAGEFACLGLSGLYFGLFVQWWLGNRDAGLALWATWLPAIAPMIIWMRHSAQNSQKTGSMADASYFCRAGGAFFTGVFGVWTFVACVVAKFWQPACPVDRRSACVAFFATVLLVSSSIGLHPRHPIAPFTGLLALFGLMSAACGAWGLPLESLVLWGALAVWLYGQLAQTRSASAPTGLRWELSAVLRVLTLACSVSALVGALLFGLTESPRPWCLGGALLLAAWWLRGVSARFLRGEPASPQSAAFKLQVLAFGISLAVVVCHALLLAGVQFPGLAVGLGGVMLFVLVLRQLLAWTSASTEALSAARSALTWPALCIGATAFVLALVAKARQDVLACGVTVVELVLATWGLTVLLRRGRAQVRGLWAGEAAGWMLLVFGLSAVAEHYQLRDPAFWTLCAAGIWVIGRIAGSLASAVIGGSQADASPPFLETRSCAAMLVAVLGLLAALLRFPSDAQVGETFLRTLSGTALLMLFGAHVLWSRDEQVNAGARSACAFSAYALLLPGAWLICAQASFVGYAPLAFYALAPLLALVALGYARAGRAGHARAAHLGAGVTCVGACALCSYGPLHTSAGTLALTLCASLALLFLLRRTLGWRTLSALVGLGVICSAFALTR